MDFNVTYTIEIRVFISSFSARNFLEPAMSSIKKGQLLVMLSLRKQLTIKKVNHKKIYGDNNGMIATVSRKLAKLLTVSHKSHHPLTLPNVE